MLEDDASSPYIESIDATNVVVASSVGAVTFTGLEDLPIPLQLPLDLPRFTGRKEDASRLKDALSYEGPCARVLGVHGMGGVGKTALAVHVAQQLHRGRFPDGVLWADLSVDTSDAALAGFISSLGHRVPTARTDRVARYRSLAQDKRVLVIIDNASDVSEVVDLLPNCPRAAALITSRSDLSALDWLTASFDLDVFSEDEAFELMRKYVGQRMDTQETAARRICELVGYLPMAVSIVGARLADPQRWPILEDFQRRLEAEETRLDQLSQGQSVDRDVRAVLRISYDLLPGRLRAAFANLSLFGVSQFGSSAGAALLQSEKEWTVDTLEDLVDLSLLLRSDRGGYRLHSLVALMASDVLRETMSPDDICAAEERRDAFGARQAEASSLREEARELVRSGQLDEALECQLRGREIEEELGSRSGLARSYGGCGSILVRQGRLQDAAYAYEQCEALSRRIGDYRGRAVAAGGIGSIHLKQNRFSEAIQAFNQSLALAEEAGDLRGQAASIGGLASVYLKQRRLDEAAEAFARSLAFNEQAGDLRGQAASIGGLAWVHLKQCRFDEAAEAFARSLGSTSKSATYRARPLPPADWRQPVSSRGASTRRLRLSGDHLHSASESATHAIRPGQRAASHLRT